MALDSGMQSKRLEFATFDVFTDTRLQGNPLAIVKVPKDQVLPQQLKQAIAREFNFSETVFLHQAESESSLDRKLDIFTVTSELPFAGHPTIGSVCCVGAEADKDIEFAMLTKAGPVPSQYDKDNAWAKSSVPHNVHIHQQPFTRAHLGLDPGPIPARKDDMLDLWPRKSNGEYPSFPIVSIVKGMSFILIAFPNVETYLQKLKAGRQMAYADMVTIDQDWAPSFIAPYFYAIISECKGEPIKVRSRMIEPAIGEDPGTGSAACTLGAYLALQRGKPAQNYQFSIEQGVEMGRACTIGIEVILDKSGETIEQLIMSGTAIKVTEGSLML